MTARIFLRRPQPPFTLPDGGQILLLEAPPGTERRNYLHPTQRDPSTRVLLIDVDSRRAGPWAGLRDLFAGFYRVLTEEGHATLVDRHAGELARVLPEHRQDLGWRPRGPAGPHAATRTVEGLVTLFHAYRELTDPERNWVLALDHFDRISRVGRAFFRALLAREPQGDSVGLVLAVAPGNGLTAAESFPRRIKYWHGRDLPPGPITSLDKEALHARARLLEREVEDSRALFEVHAAELLYLFELCDEPKHALRIRCRAAEIFYALGLVEDALDYGEEAWQSLRHLEDPEAFHDLRWALFTVLFLGHLGRGTRDEAERLAQESRFLSSPLELPRRARLHHLMAALYAPHLEGADAWHTYPGVRLDLEGLETRALAELATALERAPW